MRILIGLLGRLVFWVGLIVIVGHGALASYRAGDLVMAILKVVFFPFTFLLYPWFAGLWWLFLVSMVGYWLSTIVGRMEPVD
ncbi:MAG: hypothetical protein QMD08_00775 [Actinomycetota bacterium]|nr:hypothetical protein [Actinomycetota bacterium]